MMEKPFIIVARRAGMAYQNISRIVQTGGFALEIYVTRR